VTKHISEDEFRTLLTAALPRLRRFALSLTGSLDDADDLLHSTVERALRKAALFQPGTDLDRWLFRVCKNLWLDEWRANKKRVTDLDAGEPQNEPWSDGAKNAHARLRVKEFEKALATLDPDHRAIIVLVLVEGHAYKEVAAMLDIPMGTVMSRLARARQKIIDLMNGPKNENETESNVVKLEGRPKERR